MSVLKMEALSDRHLVDTAVSSQRTIEWQIHADAAKQFIRSPLHLAIILDRSGSMQGEKLHFVQQAACHVLDMLDERDRVAFVAYDDEVQLVAPSTAVTSSARELLKRRVNSLFPGGWTDMSSGWLEGCRAIASEQTSEIVHRALLLTDGLANRGITDIEDLTHHARQLRMRGIATSAFGVGLDFNEHLLEALATQGGGHFYYIETPRAIPAIFNQELGELLTVVAREAFVVVTIPSGVAVEILGDIPHERQDNQLRIFLGDIFAGEERSIYARVLTPPDAVGTSVVVGAELCFVDLEQCTHRMMIETPFSYANEREVRSLSLNEAVLKRASEIELAAAATRALKLERSGDVQGAQATLTQALASTAAYAPAPAVAQYGQLAHHIREGIDEQTRKAAQFAAYRTRQSRK